MLVCEPLISIVVPIYNVQQYLPQCILSIRQQTYKNIQIILVDDGSTDGSSLICDMEALQDSRIEVIHQENEGLVSARKAGLKGATGSYIGFVDADDYIEKDMFEKLFLKIVEQEVDFVHSGYIEDGCAVYGFREQRVILDKTNRIGLLKSEIFAGHRIQYSIWSKLFKAELIRKVYLQIPNEYSYGEDMLSLCGCMMECDSFYLYQDAFYHYRIREHSLSHLDPLEQCAKESLLYLGVCNLLKQYMIDEECRADAEAYYKKRLFSALSSDFETISIERYQFASASCLQGKRIALYGAGKVGQGYYSQISKYTNCKIVAWVDKKYQRYDREWIRVMPPEKLMESEFDILLIAVEQEQVAAEIKEELKSIGKKEILSKIIWEKPIQIW